MMENAWIRTFAAAAGFGMALSTAPAHSMPENNDYFEATIKQTFTVTACTKDGYSVPADIGVNPSVMDLKRLNPALPRKLDVVIAELSRQAGLVQLKKHPGFRAAYEALIAQKANEGRIDAFVNEGGRLLIQREVSALWQDIAGQLTVEDFTRPGGQPAQAPYYSKNMLEIAPKAAPGYQQRIEDNSNVSVMFLHVAPAQGEKEWQPVKGCPAPQ